MKKKFLLFLFGVCLALPSLAYDFWYNITPNGGEAMTLGFNSVSGAAEVTTYDSPYVIPTASFTYTLPNMVPNEDGDVVSVVGVGDGAFQDATGNDNTIRLASTMTYLGANSFRNFSGLVAIDFYTSKITSIGEAAFYGCTDLASFDIPTTLTSIAANTFYGCTSLTEIVIPANITSIGGEAFAYCEGLATITCDATTPPTLGDDVFAGLDCSTITLIVPEGSEEAYQADSQWGKFYTETESPFKDGDPFTVDGLVYNIVSATEYTAEVGSNLTYSGAVNIPETVTYSGVEFTVIGIGDNAFSNANGTTHASVSSVVMTDNITYIGQYAFRSNGATLTSVTWGKNVETIGQYAFYNCYYWTGGDLVIPEKVTRIEAQTFYGCSKLTSVDLSNVTYVGNSAFLSCTGLTSITLGEGVTEVGNQTFANCSALTTVTSLNPEPPTCDDIAFNNVTLSDVTLRVPCAGKDAYAEASVWSGFGTIETVDECGDEPTGDGGVPDGYVLNPANGAEVPSLSVITIDSESGIDGASGFYTEETKALFKVVNDETNETVATLGNWEVLLDETTYHTWVEITLSKKVSEAGSYTVTIPEGAVLDKATYDSNPEFTVTYYVTGETTGGNYVIVIDPESGTTHSSLSEFSLTCADGFALNDFDNPLEVKKDEVVVAHAWFDTPIMDGVSYIGYTFTFSDTSDGPESLTLTDEGTYTIYVPKEYFILGDNVSEYNDEFTITYYLEGGGVSTTSFNYTVDPPTDEEVDGLSVITLTSDEVDGFLGNYEGAAYTQEALVYSMNNRGDAITTGTMTGGGDIYDDYDTSVIITLKDEITEPGGYRVVIPEASFYVIIDGTPYFNEEITLSYGVAEPQSEYTFDPEDSKTLSSLSEFTVGYEDGIYDAYSYLGQITVEDEHGEVVAYDVECIENEEPDAGFLDPILSCTIILNTTITAKGTYTVTIPQGYFVVGESGANSKELTITYNIDGTEEGTPLTEGTEFSYDGLNYQVVSSEERTVEVVKSSSYSGAADIPAKFSYENVTYTVIGIGESAFWDGSNYNGNLTSVVMPSTVTYIGYRGFYHCNKITSVTLSENLESIGTEAFRGDSGIEGDLVIPDGVTTIENYTFQSCSHLSSITIGNGVTTIGQQAFFECTAATELIVGSSVTEINTQAFGSCTALTSVTSLNPAPPECGSSVFSSVPVSSIPLYVPAGSKDLYQGSGTWQDFYEIIELDGTGATSFVCVVDPEDGKTIDKLESIEFYNPTDGEEIFFNDYADGAIVVNDASGNLVTQIANVYTDFGPNWEENGQMVYFEETVTEPGTYYVEVPAETFFIYDASGNTLYNAAMHLTYTISSDSGDESPNGKLTFTPADGSEVGVLDAISIFCEEGITCVLMPAEEITITDGNNTEWTGNYTIEEVTGDSGTVTEVVITFTPTISDPGTYYVHVPAGYFQVGQQVNTEFTLTYYVTGVTTGISGFSITDDNVEGIYSTGGQKLNQTQRGVNIIRFSDGSVKKLYVK